MDRPGHDHLIKALEGGLNELEGVSWCQVNPVLGRVVVAFDPEGPTVADVLEVIEALEEAHGVAEETFPHDRPEHPADSEPARREAMALAADVLGLGAGVFGQVLRLTPIPVELASLASLVDAEPRVRDFLEHHLGAPVTDAGLSLSNAFAQALAQGPFGLVVDATHRANLLRESQERRRAWVRNEKALHPTTTDLPERRSEQHDPPAHPPPGPVERYADRAALASLAVAGAALPLTGSPRRAASFVVAGVPKAGRMGREAFAGSLGRHLANRDVVVLDRAVLRRLDRLDVALFDVNVMVRGAVRTIETVDQAPEEMHTAVFELFDARDIMSLQRRGDWALGPIDVLRASGTTVSRGCGRRATALRRRGAVLGIVYRGQVTGLAVIDVEVDAMGEVLIETARGGALEVALVGDGRLAARVAERLGGVDVLPGGNRRGRAVAALQRDRHGVLMISTDGDALRAADCGVGVVRGTVPWEADLLTTSLTEAHLVVAAAAAARGVSRRSAVLAAVGSGIGGAWSLMGPAGSAGRRALLPVNAAALAAQVTGIASAEALNRHRVSPPRREPSWHAMTAPDVLAELGTSPEGLSPSEAAARRVVHRHSAPPLPLRMTAAVGAELANPLSPVLGIGAGLAAAVGSVADAGLVASVMGVNAVVGGVQRLRAEVSIDRLARVSSDPVAVRRAGVTSPLDRDELVRGDLVELGPGEVVPADCRILEAVGCEVDESVLSGESLPVLKRATPTPGAAVTDRQCMLYEGTTVSAGRALAVVVAVDSDTEVGRSLADAPAPPPSGVEARISTLTALTVPVTVASGVAVSAMSLARGRPPRRAVSSGVSLMVAAVPEGLPLLASMAQLASARRLSQRGALVRAPRTIEALGRVDTLCFDKTGTLTLGEISLQRVSDGARDEPVGELSGRSRAVLAAAVRASPPDHDGPHATDRAIVVGAEGVAVSAADGLGGWRVLGELAFDPVRGYHAVVGAGPLGTRVSVKGAPEVILPRCVSWFGPEGPVPINARVRRRLEAEADRLARRGLRVLAVAERASSARSEVGDERVHDMELMGFVGLADSVRPAAAAAVAELRAAGINVVMITGDHPSTARAIGAELDMVNGRSIVTGPELEHMPDAALDAMVDDVSIFARITPKDKVRIVRAYQRVGRVVAMTGDGANDAPAIRLAHAGIALGERSSPAAREAADLVVVDDRIETILAAVVEGRALWASVRNALAILVGGNLGEVAFTVTATALSGESPLGPRQLLLVNLLTDMLPAMTIAMQPPSGRTSDMLRREGPDASLGTALLEEIALRAATTTVGSLSAGVLARGTGTRRRASTVALVALVGTQLGQTAAVGDRSPLVLLSSAASAATLAAIVQTLLVSQFFGCTPLGPLGWTIAVGAAATATGMSLAAPWAFARLHRPPSSILAEIRDVGQRRRIFDAPWLEFSPGTATGASLAIGVDAGPAPLPAPPPNGFSSDGAPSPRRSTKGRRGPAVRGRSGSSAG